MRRTQDLEKYLLTVVRGEQTGFLPTLLLAVLALLEQIYYLLLSVTAVLKKRHILKVPVISVGNLTVGGTGKTPTIVWLARELQTIGLRPAVLTRGYGGKLGKEGQVLGTANLTEADPIVVGDEPFLLANLLPGVVVAVGRDRYLMGLKALAVKPAPDLFLLDDGFQYWRLKRQLDIVLLDATMPFANGHLLPRGLLREPPQSLKRAQVVLLTRTDQVGRADLNQLTELIKKYNPRVVVGEVQTENSTLTPLVEWGRELKQSLSAAAYLQGRRIGLVTAIGNPDQLRNTLVNMGSEIVYYEVYSDHHVWNRAEIAEIIANLRMNHLRDLVVTGKDGVKLKAFTAELQSNGIDCYILSLDFKITNPEIVALIKRVAQQKG